MTRARSDVCVRRTRGTKPFRIVECALIDWPELMSTAGPDVSVVDVRRLTEKGLDSETELLDIVTTNLGGEPSGKTLATSLNSFVAAVRAWVDKRECTKTVLLGRIPDSFVNGLLTRLMGAGRRILEEVYVWNSPVVLILQLSPDQIRAVDWSDEVSHPLDFCDPPEYMSFGTIDVPLIPRDWRQGVASIQKAISEDALTSANLARVARWPNLDIESAADHLESVPWESFGSYLAQSSDHFDLESRRLLLEACGAKAKDVRSETRLPYGLRVLANLIIPPRFRDLRTAQHELAAGGPKRHAMMLLMGHEYQRRLKRVLEQDEFFVINRATLTEVVEVLGKQPVLSWDALRTTTQNAFPSNIDLGRLQCAASLMTLYRIRTRRAHGLPYAVSEWARASDNVASYIGMVILVGLRQCRVSGPIPKGLIEHSPKLSSQQLRLVQKAVKSISVDRISNEVTRDWHLGWARIGFRDEREQ